MVQAAVVPVGPCSVVAETMAELDGIVHAAKVGSSCCSGSGCGCAGWTLLCCCGDYVVESGIFFVARAINVHDHGSAM